MAPYTRGENKSTRRVQIVRLQVVSDHTTHPDNSADARHGVLRPHTVQQYLEPRRRRQR